MLKAVHFIFYYSFIFFIPVKSIGQNTFEKAIAPGVGKSIIKHNDGSFVIGTDYSYLLLYKVNGLGDTIWGKSYGVSGMNGGTYAGDIQLTSDSNLIIVGAKWPSSATREMYVLKTDTLGNILWETSIAAGGDLNGISIKETPDNYYIACGTLENGTSNDIYVVKFDSLGNIVWQNFYHFFNRDYFGDLIILNINSYIICGHTNSVFETNAILFQIDSAGILSWSKVLGDTMTNLLQSIILTPDSNLLIGGYTVNSITSNIDAWIIKTSLTGDTIWSHLFGNQFDQEIVYSITNSDSIFYCAGDLQTNSIPAIHLGFILAFDFNGNSKWIKNYGNLGETFKDLYYDPSDSSIVATGLTKSFQFTAGIYLIKMDSNGLLNNIENYQKSEYTSYTIHPNPTTSNINFIKINSFSVEKIEIVIYNMNGKLIMKNSLLNPANSFQVNTENFPNGIYLIKIVSFQNLIKNPSSYIYKLIKH